MKRLAGVIGVSVVAVAGCGTAEQPATSATTEDLTTTTQPTEHGPDSGEVHQVDINGSDLTVGVEIRPSYRRPPTEPRSPDDETLLHLERWLDPETGGSIGWSAQVDPGDDALLFQYDVADEFETVLGTWTVHELGEGMFTHYMAMVRHDGLVYQVIGGAPDNPSPVIEMAQSMKLGG